MTTKFAQKEERCCVPVPVAISVTVILFLPTNCGDLFPPFMRQWDESFSLCVFAHTCICTYVCTYTEVYVQVILFTHASGNGCQGLFLIKADTIIASITLHRYSQWKNLALCFISHIHIQNGIIKTFRRKRMCCWLYSSFQGIWDGLVVWVSLTHLCLSPLGSWWHSEWLPSCLLWEGLWIWRLSSTDPVWTSCRTQT